MLNKFFWMCSGADPDLLQESPKSERIKQAGIGGTVFFTAVMAFIASAFALFTIFNNVWIAIGFGVVWGLLIFNLDRFIVSTLRKREHPWQEWLQATPRILLAILIAVVIAKPLELKIFEKEIDQILLTQKHQLSKENQLQVADLFLPEIDRLVAENNQLKQAVVDKEAEVNALYDTYITEAEGTKGTMKIGKGPVYEEKREKHDAALAELKVLREQNNDKVAANDLQIAELRTEQQTKTEQTQPIVDGFDGLMARIAALDQLPYLPQFFIFLLFIAIETAPVLAKLISPRGAYDLRFEDQYDQLRVWMEQKRQQRSELQMADQNLNEKVYPETAKEEELFIHRRQKAREILQMQSEAFFKEQQDILNS